MLKMLYITHKITQGKRKTSDTPREAGREP